jgi:apolipoprotein N-acyltransferase
MKPRLFLPAMLSGLLLWASFFPLNLGPLAFVALVPWLALVRAEGVNRWRRYLAAFVGGLCFFVPALQWIRVAHPAMYASWIVMAVYCSLYFVLALYLLRRLDKLTGLPLAFTVPVVWVALDYCRAHFPTGFPILANVNGQRLIGFGWYMLGYTQHATAPLIQLADLGGVYLVTALLAAFNGAVHDWMIRQAWLRRVLFGYPPDARIGFFREMWVAASVTLALIASVAYGITRLQHPEFLEGPRVAALQGNLEQDVKMDNEKKLFGDYTELSRRAAARADLIVWPETCCPHPWSSFTGDATSDYSKGKVAELQREFFEKDTAGVWKRPTLVGLTTYEVDGGELFRYNSALMITPDLKVQGRYDKIHLVPFGEYVPCGETFPWLQTFTPYKGNYSCKPGERLTRFPLVVGNTEYTFGVLICYEDSEPLLARQYVTSEPVDFLVNISNDGWFKGTEEHEQHLATCRFRAVECRRTVVRAVNMGISAFIDPDGKVYELPGDSWSQSKRMEEVVVGKVKLDARGSYYAEYGDWLPGLCWALIAIAMLARFVKRRFLTAQSS